MVGWDWANSCSDSGGCSRLLPKVVSGIELCVDGLLKVVSGIELCVDGLICESREDRDKRRVLLSSDNVDINVIARSKKRVNL
jgi:hypothetical protein